MNSKWNWIAGLGLLGVGSWVLWWALRPLTVFGRVASLLRWWWLMRTIKFMVYQRRAQLWCLWGGLILRALTPQHTPRQRVAVLRAAWMFRPWRVLAIQRSWHPAPTAGEEVA